MLGAGEDSNLGFGFGFGFGVIGRAGDASSSAAAEEADSAGCSWGEDNLLAALLPVTLRRLRRLRRRLHRVRVYRIQVHSAPMRRVQMRRVQVI